MWSPPFSKIKDVLPCILHENGVVPPSGIEDLVYILQRCGKQRNLFHALHLHAYTCECGLETHALLGNCLLEMLVEVGGIMHAQTVFNKLLNQDERSWNCLITGYVDCGDLRHAFILYNKMRDSYSLRPSAYIYVALLRACTLLKDLQRGDNIHEDIIKEGLLEGNVFLGSTLVNMYAKCGFVLKAETVFDKLIARNEVLWNSLIAGYSDNGYDKEALQYLVGMQQQGIIPDAVTFVCGLKSCGSIRAANMGHEIHTKIIRLGFLERDIFVGNSLIDMYVKFGSFDKAKEVFFNLPNRNLVSWNTLIAGYADHGHGEEVLTCFEQMQQEAVPPDAVTLVCSLKACGSVGALFKGQEMHCEITKKGLLETDAFMGTALVDMYMKCDLHAMAHDIFKGLPFQDVVSWNALITGQVDHGHCEEALLCLEHMRLDGICPDSITFVGCLKACSSIGTAHSGQEVHTEIVKKGLENDPLIGSTLVDMYFKSGLLVDAQQVFDELPDRSVVAWNSLMAGYIEHGHIEKAFEWFEHMLNEHVSFDALTLVNSLKACSVISATMKGQEIHSQIVKTGFFETDVFVSGTLVDMYAKCGMLVESEKVFNKIPAQDVVAWTTLISGYVEHGWFKEALCCFERMQCEGISPGAITIACGLKACSNMKLLKKGQEINVTIVQKGLLEREYFICSALLDMYAKCESIVTAQYVFNKLSVKDMATWTALMLGFLESGQSEEVLCCLEQMQQEGVSPSPITLVFSIKACGNISALNNGKEIHSEVFKRGFEKDSFIGNALVGMYSTLGYLEEAQNVFIRLPDQDVFSWAALLAGYADHGDDEEAIHCYQLMQLKGVSACVGACVSCMKACGSIRAVGNGHVLHAEVIRKGYDNEVIVGNMLVDMYISCGLLVEAEKVFDDVSTQSVVQWNALIQGYAEHKGGKEAIDLFEKMQQHGVSPDVVTFVCSLKACGMIGTARKGQEIHAEIALKGLEREISICNTLVDMYAKCGLLAAAQETFDKLQLRDAVSWTALISGHVGHGCGEGALDYFDQMQQESMIANAVTLVCCLKACGNMGAAVKGRDLHVEIMKKGLERELVIGNTLVDMYGRCGLLALAQEVFNKLPVRDLISWNALIAGYAQLGDSKMVFDVFEMMLLENIKPNPVTFISVLNVCSHAGLLDMSRIYFDALSDIFSLTPSLEHYTCIVDTLGRAGHVDKAIATIINMPLHPSVVMWHTVLGACIKGANVELAKHAFGHVVQLDENDCASYICLSNIYAVAPFVG